MGEAAGVVASQAIRTGKLIRELSFGAIESALNASGAILQVPPS